MRVVGGVDIERVYTIYEIMDLYHAGRLQPVALKGYVVRADADGSVRFVPWNEAFANRMTPGSQNPDGSPSTQTLRTFETQEPIWQKMLEEVEHDHPIVRRTPQQRVDSMVERMMKTATILEDSGAETLQSGFEGKLTGDVEEPVRQRAAKLLADAQVDNRAADSKRITRRHAKA